MRAKEVRFTRMLLSELRNRSDVRRMVLGCQTLGRQVRRDVGPLRSRLERVGLVRRVRSLLRYEASRTWVLEWIRWRESLLAWIWWILRMDAISQVVGE